MDADGTGVERLTDDPAMELNPAWSPDGTRIAFASDRDGDFDLYVMNADGSGVERLTHDPGDEVYPAWAPDGTKIAFAGTPVPELLPVELLIGDLAIYVMNADGTDVNRLTNRRDDNFAPSWSPDGTALAFVSDRDVNQEIYVMGADGTGVRRLTDDPAEDVGPVWSPTG